MDSDKRQKILGVQEKREKLIEYFNARDMPEFDFTNDIIDSLYDMFFYHIFTKCDKAEY